MARAKPLSSPRNVSGHRRTPRASGTTTGGGPMAGIPMQSGPPRAGRSLMVTYTGSRTALRPMSQGTSSVRHIATGSVRASPTAPFGCWITKSNWKSLTRSPTVRMANDAFVMCSGERGYGGCQGALVVDVRARASRFGDCIGSVIGSVFHCLCWMRSQPSA